jgi:hypothetical protein
LVDWLLSDWLMDSSLWGISPLLPVAST